MWNEEQKAVIKSNAPVKQVIAAAGSGKTATMIGLLAEQERNGGIRPDRTLIVTFTNKAAEEFQNRILQNLLSDRYIILTFHAFCYQMIKSYHPIYSKSPMRIIEKKQLEAFTIDFLYKDRFKIGGTPFSILFRQNAYYFKSEHPEIYEKYIKALSTWKAKENLLEFEDLPLITLNGLENKENWTHILPSLFDSVIVDEFQDTDTTQLKILQQIRPPNLTVVGDDWQAIYGFRGATPEPFLNFPSYFNKTEQFFLTTNYRSLKGIIDLSTHALQKNKSKISKIVKSHRNGNASVLQFTMENPKSDRYNMVQKLEKALMEDKESIMLVRSNFRRKEWIQSGIPEKKITTIHAAKGLEYRTVILDLSAGWSMPESMDNTLLEEERRILYVGISRAKDELILLGRKLPKRKQGLEDEFFSYFRNFDSQGKPTLRYRLLW